MKLDFQKFELFFEVFAPDVFQQTNLSWTPPTSRRFITIYGTYCPCRRLLVLGLGLAPASLMLGWVTASLMLA